MITKYKKISVVLAVAGLGYGLWLMQNPMQQGCLAHLSGALLFDVTMSDATLLPTARTRDPSDTGGSSMMQGVVRFDAADGADGPASELVGRFEPIQLHQGGTDHQKFRGFDHPFTIHMDQSCQFSQVEFDGRMPVVAREAVQHLLSVLRLAQATTPSIEIDDFAGRSRFVQAPKSGSGDRAYGRQELLAPLDGMASANAVQVKTILGSLYEFDGPTTPIGVTKATGHERLVIHVGDGKEATMVYSITISRQQPGKKVAVSKPVSQSVPPRFRVLKAPGQVARGHDHESSYDIIDPNENLDGTLDAAMQRFIDMVDGKPTKAKRQLIAFLRLHPEAFTTLHDRIAGEDYSDGVLVHLLFAIAKTGSPESQSCLATLIGDDGLGDSTRLRVLFAANEVALPSSELIGVVRTMTGPLREGEPSGMNDHTTTALYSSAIMANRLIDVAPGDEATLAQDLRDVFNKATTGPVRAVAIDAAGNYGSIDLADIVVPALNASEESERRAAFDALRNMPIPGREGLIAQALTSETRSEPRRAAFRALAAIGVTSLATVQAVEVAAKKDPEAVSREEAVHALGKASATMPEAQSALKRLIGQESNTQVLVAAGRYLNAAELAMLIKGR